MLPTQRRVPIHADYATRNQSTADHQFLPDQCVSINMLHTRLKWLHRIADQLKRLRVNRCLSTSSIWNQLILLLHVILLIEARQQITSRGGFDIDGERLFICRSHKYGQIIPGKYSKGIKKCSVTHNRNEAQFSRYEILVESGDTRYEWIALKKPVISLPENVLFGGNQYAQSVHKRPSVPGERIGSQFVIADAKGELNSRSLDNILSNDQLWGSRKRRMRRSTDSEIHWSRNWRGRLNDGVDRIQRFNRKSIMLNEGNSTQLHMNKAFRRQCSNQIDTINLADNCLEDPQKSNFYISKCTLRTGNITSEQIGKIRWKESIQEWIASFGFGGHEIYCLDYSVLTLKTKI